MGDRTEQPRGRLSVERYGDRVLVFIDGAIRGDLRWEDALELGGVLGRTASIRTGGFEVEIIRVGRRAVRIAGGRVEILYDGGLVADLDARSAHLLGGALIGVARMVEEWVKAEKVASDAAVLMRAGVPVGLANHEAIIQEAARRADGDRDLRRFMPNNLSERSVVGAPTLGGGARLETEPKP